MENGIWNKLILLMVTFDLLGDVIFIIKLILSLVNVILLSLSHHHILFDSQLLKIN